MQILRLTSEERRAGLAIPLFSLRTAASWGIGEILDLVPLANWCSRMHQGIVQLLPINETSPGEASPYFIMSAFAIDPLYLSLSTVEDLPPPARRRPEHLPASRRGAGPLPRDAIREAKLAALFSAWRFFRKAHLDRKTTRAGRFERFAEREKHWLDDYALFRSLKEQQNGASWKAWPQPLRRRERQALASAAVALSERLDFFRYVQWLAAEQWSAARQHARRRGVWLKGDLPFVVSEDSADAWANPDLFVPGWEIGAPPDAFSAEGQNWGLPLYDWERLRSTDYRWWRPRIRQAGDLYDLFRLDHIIGFYRTYAIALERPTLRRFFPERETDQITQGEEFLRMVQEECGGAIPVAEDLGVIPEFARQSFRRQGIPGYKVWRWETRAGRFIDPRQYEPLSVATTGTHDTSTLAQWWAGLSPDERKAFMESLQLPAGETGSPPPAKLTTSLRRQVLARLYEAGSVFVVLPVQDLFGWTERINLPKTVSAENWNYRLPFQFGPRGEVPTAIRREGTILRRLTDASGRYRRGGRAVKLRG